ncbi:MAG TPA: SIS domain-containing protein [Syntrophomonas sp.]|nr:SIS domain-containing protein [Syntrophomonas sp.]
MELRSLLDQTFQIESECLENGSSYIDEAQFARAVEALRSSQRIAACGCGHSGILCQHFAHLMCCIEKPARFIAPGEAVHGGMGYLQSGDVMVFASRGGNTQELFPIMEICKARNVITITITENVQSPLACKSDIVLRQYVTRETDRDNFQGTTSSTVLCVIFHALQAAIIEATDFQVRHFAQIHPGGAVGAKLNGRNL